MGESDSVSFIQHLIESGTDFDHPDMDEIKLKANSFGMHNDIDIGQHFFVARELKSLQEDEQLHGGDGSEVKKITPRDILEMLFSKRK